MKRTVIYFAAAVLSAAVFTGCNEKSQVYNDYENAKAPRMMSAKMESADFMADDSLEVNEAVSSFTQSDGEYERKLVKNGNLSIQIEDLAAADKSIGLWCTKFGGYISYQSSSADSAYYRVKIPAASFDGAMDEAGEFGTVKSRDISTDDVSEQFYDLETRIETKKIMRDNLKNYLSQAKNVSEIMTIEKELNSVVTELEQMEGRMKRLSNQIDYSTINVSVSLPAGKSDPSVDRPGFGDAAGSFFRGAGAFFGVLLTCLCYLVICGIPLAAVILFLYWLLFGKCGLLKKLFRRLK